MARRTRSQWLLVSLVCLLAWTAPAARAQRPDRPQRITIVVPDAHNAAQWPVAITRFSIDGRPVPLGRPITVSAHWLSKTVVTLRNLSPKAIVQVGMFITFPESGDGSSAHPYQGSGSELGQVPKVVYTDRNGIYHPPSLAEREPLRVPPGGVIRLSFAKYADEVQASLAAKAVPITQATLTFTTIYFADDSRWSAGQYYLAPHPAPGSWTRVTKEQFFRGANTAR